jgi:hypothetical protein
VKGGVMMVLLTKCHACRRGDHEHHSEVIQAALPGMIGGMRCPCKGECVERGPGPEAKKIAADVIDSEGRIKLDALATNEMKEGVVPTVILPPMPLRLLLEDEGIDPDQVSELVVECAWWHEPKIRFKYRDDIKHIDVTITKEMEAGDERSGGTE